MGVNDNKSVKNQIRKKVYDQLSNHVRHRIWYYDCDKVWDQIGDEATVTIWQYIRDSLWDQIDDER